LQTQFWQNQARSQLLRFGGENKFLGKDFYFYHMFKTIYFVQENLGDHKKE